MWSAAMFKRINIMRNQEIFWEENSNFLLLPTFIVHSFFENSMCYAGHIIARYAKTVHDSENETKILNRVKGNFITLEETNLSTAHQV